MHHQLCLKQDTVTSPSTVEGFAGIMQMWPLVAHTSVFSHLYHLCFIIHIVIRLFLCCKRRKVTSFFTLKQMQSPPQSFSISSSFSVLCFKELHSLHRNTKLTRIPSFFFKASLVKAQHKSYSKDFAAGCLRMRTKHFSLVDDLKFFSSVYKNQEEVPELCKDILENSYLMHSFFKNCIICMQIC